MRFSVKSASIGKLYFAIWFGSIQSPYNLADLSKIHPIVRFDTWNIWVHQTDPISGGRGVKPAVQKAHNKWSVPCTFSRKLPRRAKSWPEIEIAIKRLAFSSQTPSIEPSYKTGPKQVKMSISQKLQGFLKIFRVQNVALTVRRPKHPSLVWCTGIFLCETFSRLVPRLSNWGHHM